MGGDSGPAMMVAGITRAHRSDSDLRFLVFGDKEQEAGAVSVRVRGKGDQGSVPLTEFIAKAKGFVESKAMELS